MLFTGATKGCGLRFFEPMLSKTRGVTWEIPSTQTGALGQPKSKRSQALCLVVKRQLVDLCWRD